MRSCTDGKYILGGARSEPGVASTVLGEFHGRLVVVNDTKRTHPVIIDGTITPAPELRPRAWGAAESVRRDACLSVGSFPIDGDGGGAMEQAIEVRRGDDAIPGTDGPPVAV